MCNERYYDESQLVRHLTREHFSCHLCARATDEEEFDLSPQAPAGGGGIGRGGGGREMGRGRGTRGGRGMRGGVQARLLAGGAQSERRQQDVEFFREYADLEVHFRDKVRFRSVEIFV
jgi:hypothetical protein